MNYTQCTLQRDDAVQVTWIPSQFATVGRSLRLRDGGVWVDGWIVREVWQTVSEDQVPDAHAERAAHKRATGDVSA